jgi:hypothetical protein
MSPLVGNQRVLLNGAPFSPLSIPNCALWLEANPAFCVLSTASYTLTGTVAQSGNTLTGVLTIFLTEVKLGDNISGGGVNGNVTAIASDTSLTLDSSATVAAGDTVTCAPVAGTSDRVTTWTDRSLAAANATRSPQTGKPTFRTGVLNSLPTIRFIGTTDALLTSVAQAQPNVVFVVGQANTTGVNSRFYDGIGGTNRQIAFVNATGPVWSLFAGLTVSSGTPNTSWHVLTAIFNGASSFLRVDGTQVIADNPSTKGVDGFTIGNHNGLANPLNGDIYAMLNYNRLLAMSEIQQIERWLGKKTGIVVA